MTSFARAALAVLMILGSGVAQAAPPAAPTVSAELAGEVAARIAGDWEVDPSALSLRWGHVPASVARPGAEVLRLIGRGSNGWLAVVVQPAEGRAISVRVRAGLTDSVWVAARELAAGSVLETEDMRAETRLRWGPPRSAGQRPDPGWDVRRRLAAGDELAPPMVVPPAWVTAGESVRLEWSRGGVSIALTGVALNSAREGGTVRARVSGRAAPVSGIVTGPGLATLLRGGRI